MRTQPHSNAKRFIKSCRKRLQHVPRVGAEKDNYQQKGPVKTKKLTVGNFYIFHTLAVIALSFLKLLIKIKWKNIKKIPTVSFKIQVFGTELDSWWRLKSSLLRRALKIVSPCRAFCIVLFSICVINRWGDAVHLLKGATVDSPIWFWLVFGVLPNFFEALSKNFRLYKSKNAIGFLINQLADFSKI